MYITLDEFVAMGGRNFDYTQEFDRIAKKAASYVDYYTQGRLKAAAYVDEGVKTAMFELCELILEGSGEVLSYSSDGVSVKLSERATFDNKVCEIIRRNIPQRLLYLGVEKGEESEK